MMQKWGGKSRNALRKTSNRGTGDDHIFQLEGAQRLSIFIPPNSRIRGYKELSTHLESYGCTITYPSKSLEVLRELPTASFTAINIESKEGIEIEALQMAHRWAHQRNLLHSFFIPL